MGGFIFETSPDGASTKTRDVPKYETFIEIMQRYPDIIPDISENSITDRAESGILSKILLVAHVGWFCINCICRLIQHLPLSLLEVSTIAHAVCTLLTYFTWCSKPLNIAEGTIIKGEEAQRVYKEVGRDKFRTYGRIMAVDSNRTEPSQQERAIYAIMAVSPMIYGLLHFLAWSGRFPTPLEHLLWRVSSGVVTCSGLLFISFGFAAKYIEKKSYDRGYFIARLFELLSWLMMLGSVLIPLVYVLASGFLLVESLRQLLFLAPAAYQLPSWSNYWPHFT